MLLQFLLACKASSLGVDVPRGGPEAISQEDLQRDVFMLTERGMEDRRAGTPGGEEAARRVVDRMQQMHLLPAFGEAYSRPGGLICGQKDGRSGKAVLVAAEERGSGASVLPPPIPGRRARLHPRAGRARAAAPGCLGQGAGGDGGAHRGRGVVHGVR